MRIKNKNQQLNNCGVHGHYGVASQEQKNDDEHGASIGASF
jgi:hypothetical protein